MNGKSVVTVLLLVFLAVCIPPLARGDTTAPFFLLSSPLAFVAGRLWKGSNVENREAL